MRKVRVPATRAAMRFTLILFAGSFETLGEARSLQAHRIMRTWPVILSYEGKSRHIWRKLATLGVACG